MMGYEEPEDEAGMLERGSVRLEQIKGAEYCEYVDKALAR